MEKKIVEIGQIAYRKNASNALFTIMNPSSSSDKMYKTIIWENGSISCNCPGWTMNNRRECKHTKAAKQKIQLNAN